METKICSRCKIEKPVSEFHKCKKTGYQYWCKPCHRKDNIEYAKTGYYAEYRCRPEVVERRKEYRTEYRQRPAVMVKDFARSYLNNAIRDGRFNREPCAMCGEEQAEGHHDDYSQPLLVVWLCAECHTELHISQRRIKEKEDGAKGNRRQPS